MYKTADDFEKIGRKLFTQLVEENNPYYYIGYDNRPFAPVDFILLGNGLPSIAGDIKAYCDKNHPRESTKFKNFQIDYSKLESIENLAKQMENGIPILVCFFSNELVVWRLDTIDWRSTKTFVTTNNKGYKYGNSKSPSLQAYLYLKDAIVINKEYNIYTNEQRTDINPVIQ